MDEQASTSAAKSKSNKTWLIVAGVVLICCCITSIAAIVAWPTITSLLGSGETNTATYSGRADAVLKQDVLNVIANYESAQNGCNEVTLLMGQDAPGSGQSGDGSWSELWQILACDASHLYEITFVPSPQGGTDFSVSPIDQ
jgi:hypothetical protein